MVVEKIYVV